MYIKKKYHPIVIPFFMSFIVSGIVSSTVTIVNLGWGEPGLAKSALDGWLTAFPIAFASLFFVRPLVEKTVNRYTVVEKR